MKNLFAFSTLFLLFFTACGDDEMTDPGNNPAAPAGTITATINGVTYSSGDADDPTTATLFVNPGSNDLLEIGGLDFATEVGETINLELKTPTGEGFAPGDYSFVPFECGTSSTVEDCASFFYSRLNEMGDQVQGYSTTDGTNLNLTILQSDYRKGGSISGTFSGTVKDADTEAVFDLTDGAFDVMIEE